MPFGLTNAPATFQNLMNLIFGPYRRFILVFFDDVLVFSQTLEEHIQHLKTALQLLRENSLFVKLSKCAFAVPEVNYLGHILSTEGVSTDHSKVQDILQWPSPDSVTKFRGFLGLTGYYRRFVRNYGSICRPLYDVLKRDKFQWEEQQEQAFNKLKIVMTSCPILALPNFSKPFTIEADAYGIGLGAVLMQVGRPLAYYSKAISPTALGKSVYEKEALKKWRHYIVGNPLVIKTDQQALKYMATQRLTEGIQHKLLLKLLEFDYSIEYKKGKDNIVADALLRKDHTMEGQCSQMTIIQAEWLDDIRKSYENDSDSSKLLQKLAQDVQEESNFKIIEGILKFKNRIYIGVATDF